MAVCVHGLVAAVRGTPDGREAGLAVAGPGEALPGSSALLALSPSRVVRADPARLPELVRSLARRLEDAAAVAALGGADARVAWWLLEVAARSPRPARAVALSHAGIGLLAGVSRETACRALARFAGCGLVARDGGTIVVRDPVGLRASTGLAGIAWAGRSPAGDGLIRAGAPASGDRLLRDGAVGGLR